jgi:uncharacterized protein (DUF983 family)
MSLARARQVAIRAVSLRCPRCGTGRVFAGPLRMHARCPACGLAFEREPGYFVGAIYVNYGVTVLIAIGGYFLLEATLHPRPLTQVALWAVFAVVFPFWFFRYSKSLWLGLDYLVDPVERRPES